MAERCVEVEDGGARRCERAGQRGATRSGRRVQQKKWSLNCVCDIKWIVEAPQYVLKIQYVAGQSVLFTFGAFRLFPAPRPRAHTSRKRPQRSKVKGQRSKGHLIAALLSPSLAGAYAVSLDSLFYSLLLSVEITFSCWLVRCSLCRSLITAFGHAPLWLPTPVD
jgi:hypothetical protein